MVLNASLLLENANNFLVFVSINIGAVDFEKIYEGGYFLFEVLRGIRSEGIGHCESLGVKAAYVFVYLVQLLIPLLVLTDHVEERGEVVGHNFVRNLSGVNLSLLQFLDISPERFWVSGSYLARWRRRWRTSPGQRW